MTIVEQAKACMKKISGNWDYDSLDLEMEDNGDTELLEIEINESDGKFCAWSKDYVYFIVYWCPRWVDEYERIIASAPLRPGVIEPFMVNGRKLIRKGRDRLMREQVHGWIHKMIDVFEYEIRHRGGPAHSVIEDYNINNSSIEGDIKYINKCIHGEKECEYSVGELRCIKAFLLALLQIPELERAKQAHAYFDWDDEDASVEDYFEEA